MAKLTKKDKYNVNFTISNAVYSHNHTRARTTKFKPMDLFFNNNDSMINIVIENSIKSQKNINSNRDMYRINSFF